MGNDGEPQVISHFDGDTPVWVVLQPASFRQPIQGPVDVGYTIEDDEPTWRTISLPLHDEARPQGPPPPLRRQVRDAQAILSRCRAQSRSRALEHPELTTPRTPLRHPLPPMLYHHRAHSVNPGCSKLLQGSRGAAMRCDAICGSKA